MLDRADADRDRRRLAREETAAPPSTLLAM
jgi:hypothetical protein